MDTQGEVLAVEDAFFQALLGGDGAGLRAVLTPDFLLIDVMSGSEIPGGVLTDLVGSRQLCARGRCLAAGIGPGDADCGRRCLTAHAADERGRSPASPAGSLRRRAAEHGFARVHCS